eukprot:COSAG01_NODE_39970_length_469_cov_1.935135_2_plen_30_part_01
MGQYYAKCISHVDFTAAQIQPWPTANAQPM